MRCLYPLQIACLLLSSSLAFGESTITVHGESESDSEDPLSPTASSETIDIPSPSATLGQVLENATGVEIRRNGSMGRGESVQLRGALGHQVQFVLDEMPLLVTRGQSVDLSTFPMGMFKRVRVTRGGASVDYGSGALGGVIHMESDLASRTRSRVYVRSGSFGYHALGVNVPFMKGKNGLLVGGQYEESLGNFSFQDGNLRNRTRDNNHHHKGNVSAVGQWYTSDIGRLKLFVDLFADRRGEPGPMEFPNLTAESERRRLLLGTQLRLNPQFSGRVVHNLEVFTQIRQFTFRDPNPIFVGDPQFFQMNDLSRSTRLRSQIQLTPVLMLRTGFGATLDQIGTRKREKVHHHRFTSNATTHLEWLAFDHWLFTTGTRIEHSKKRTEFVPRLGVRYRTNAHLQWRANWSQFFRLPSLDELYYEGVGVSGNPALKAERGQSADVGLLFTPEDKILRLLSLTAFATEFSSLIFFAPIDAYRYRANNHSGGLVQGLESMTRLEIGHFGVHASYRWQHSSASYNRAIPLPFRAAHLSRISIDRTFYGVSTQLGVSSISSRTADIFGNRRIPGYLEMNASLDYRVNKSLSTSLRAENLLNGLTHQDFPTLPRPGRNISVFVRYEPLVNE